MEKTVEGIKDGIVRGWTIVRPTLLVDGAKGKIRAGWAGSEGGIPLGMSIGRDDVGKWIYETIVEKRAEGVQGKKVVLA